MPCRSSSHLVALATLALGIVACAADRRGFTSDTADAGNPTSTFRPDPDAPDAAASVCQKMDILFVIDDSGSMREEQSALGSSFPKFVSVLDKFQVEGGGLIDYRVAVTTTGRDVTYSIKMGAGSPLPNTVLGPLTQKGMNGVLRQDCGMQRRWLERNDPDVSSTFACLAQVGTGGPGVEMPLLGAELAFTDRLQDGTNVGFLRDDALLAVIFITDEEDCSRKDNGFTEIDDMCEVTSPNVIAPTHFVELFDGLKKGRGRWAAAAIAGPSKCSSAFGDAYEAARLKEFITLTGQNGVFASICDGNFENALESALKTFKSACDAFPTK